MKYVDVGGVRLSAIGLGTWQFGSGEWAYGKEYASQVAPQIVSRSLDLGVNLIDTAEIYGFGRSENIVRRALGDRRKEAFLATKIFPVAPVDPILSSRLAGSLSRLGVDAIDLYQLHWPNPVVPLGPTMKALSKARDKGLIRHVGVSNYSLSKWKEAESHFDGPVLSNQVRYSLIDRRPEKELLPWAQENGRIIIAYSPLSQGLLSGRYDVDNIPAGMRAGTPAFLPENLSRLSGLLQVLREVADSHNATCAQTALAWLLRRPNVVVIPGASSVEQAESNAHAGNIELSDDEDDALTSASDSYSPIGTWSSVSEISRIRTKRVVTRFENTLKGLRS